MVVEATYGTSSHEKRNSREQRLVDKVRSIVARGGRCLMPVVALGRAQVCCHRTAAASSIDGSVGVVRTPQRSLLTNVGIPKGRKRCKQSGRCAADRWDAS